jgi:hypothetical protein
MSNLCNRTFGRLAVPALAGTDEVPVLPRDYTVRASAVSRHGCTLPFQYHNQSWTGYGYMGDLFEALHPVHERAEDICQVFNPGYL